MSDSSREQFRKNIRDALVHLYDTAYLECSPLVNDLLSAESVSQLTRAQTLRQLLKEAIESLRPREGTPTRTPAWRSYLAYHQRYVMELSLTEIELNLGISRRQLQRELRKGLDALTLMLWERRIPPGEKLQNDEMDQLLDIHQEIGQWSINRQICQIRSLFDDIRWMLNPLLEKSNASLSLHIPERLDPIFVDPTLTRQAFFRLLRLILSASGNAEIEIFAGVDSGRVDLHLRKAGLAVDTETDDWGIAGLLITRQGGTIGQTIGEVTVSIPVTRNTSVLVIDDAPAIHRLFERYLSPHHFDVTGISDPAQAREMIEERSPDMIILDIMMPTIDGWQLLRELQSTPGTAAIPVVICSVLDEPELALSLGARAFIKKPVSRLDLIEALTKIRDEQESAAGENPAATATFPTSRSG